MKTKLALNLAACACLFAAGVATAQPEQFTDLGAHLSPEMLRVPVQLQSGDDIQWFRIELPDALATGGFVDIWSDVPYGPDDTCPANQGIDEIQLLQYSSTGDALAESFQPYGLEVIARLSFGLATDNRPPLCVYDESDPFQTYRCSLPFGGQDGPLAAGVYWFAVGHRIYPQLHNWEVLTDANPASMGRCAHLNFRIQPAGVPYCDPDLNWDGNADEGDIDYLINVIAGGDNPTGRNPDFNHDGNADQGDIDALVNVVAGGGCP